MATKFFTNHKGKTLFQKLEGTFQKLPRELKQLRKNAGKSKLKPAVIACKIIEIRKTYPLPEPRSGQEEAAGDLTVKADEPNTIF